MKVCYSCNQEKDFSEFAKDNTRGSYQRECKQCCKERKAAWHKTEAGKRSSANTKLKNRLGITLNEYEEMLKLQDGKCLGCGVTESYLGQRLAVDHCHKTGTIRGLLCKNCNIIIGHAKENSNTLLNLIKYIDERCITHK